MDSPRRPASVTAPRTIALPPKISRTTPRPILKRSTKHPLQQRLTQATYPGPIRTTLTPRSLHLFSKVFPEYPDYNLPELCPQYGAAEGLQVEDGRGQRFIQIFRMRSTLLIMITLHYQDLIPVALPLKSLIIVKPNPAPVSASLTSSIWLRSRVSTITSRVVFLADISSCNL